MSAIRNVCILGGTHGDELSGVYLVRKWKDNIGPVTRPSFNTKLCLSNPEAIALNRRYKDCDLNRQFSPENFKAVLTAETPYEVRRVQELKQMFSEGGEIGPCEVVFDLHNTTANVKTCLIHADPKDVLVRQMIRYVMNCLPPETCFALYIDVASNYDTIRSLCEHGMGVEIGPQPQGVLRGDIYQLQEKVVQHALDFLEKFNSGEEFPEAEMPVYNYDKKIPFPRDQSGEIVAMIHPKLQDKDWIPLSMEDPVFLKTDGEILYLKDVVTAAEYNSGMVYPMFINEAAYYEKDCAFCLTTKHAVKIPKLSKE